MKLFLLYVVCSVLDLLKKLNRKVLLPILGYLTILVGAAAPIGFAFGFMPKWTLAVSIFLAFIGLKAYPINS